MIKFDLNRMLYTLTPDEHDPDTVRARLAAHPEVKFVSFTGVDMGGHNTDEKIPVQTFVDDMDKLLEGGVQTDGSSVALPKIADLSNARVDIMPDPDVNWYVEYNFDNMDYGTGLPTGTLRIPSFLRHNGDTMVGSRTFLKETVDRFKASFDKALKEHPYVFEHIGGVPKILVPEFDVLRLPDDLIDPIRPEDRDPAVRFDVGPEPRLNGRRVHDRVESVDLSLRSSVGLEATVDADSLAHLREGLRRHPGPRLIGRNQERHRDGQRSRQPEACHGLVVVRSRHDREHSPRAFSVYALIKSAAIRVHSINSLERVRGNKVGPWSCRDAFRDCEGSHRLRAEECHCMFIGCFSR